MADQPTRLFRDSADKDFSTVVNRIKSDVDELVEGLDLGSIGRRFQDFGAQRPWGMAFAALAVGFAAGLLMREKGPLDETK